MNSRRAFLRRFWISNLFTLLVAALLTFISLLDVIVHPFSKWQVNQAAPAYYRTPLTRHSAVVEELLSILHDKGTSDERFIVRRGDRLTEADIKELERAYPERRQFDARRALGLFAFYFLALFFFNLVLKRSGTHLFIRFRAVSTLYLVLIFCSLGARLLIDYSPVSPYFAPSIMVTILFARLLGQALGFTLHLLAVVVIAPMVHFTPGMILVPLVCGWTAVLVLKKRESGPWRMLFATLAGMIIGGGFMLGVDLFSPQRLEFAIKAESDLTGLMGGNLSAGILAALLSYPLTQLFGCVPRSKLLSLTDLNHPLLSELAQKAPGTFQHSQAVANLAEKVAYDIGADAQLVRVGAYYHDIGKMQQPEFFIENLQGPNPHNSLRPEVSAEILRNHVEHGVIIAHGANLPGRVIDFLVEHHGRSMMEYFMDKAFQLEGKAPDPCRFEYSGRNPTSRETGILMIADSVEAASRTLKNPTHDQIEDLVRRIVFRQLLHGYLDDSGLSSTELKQASISLIQALVAQFHVRIEYPWQKRLERPPLLVVPDLHAGIGNGHNHLRVAQPFPLPGASESNAATPPTELNPGDSSEKKTSGS